MRIAITGATGLLGRNLLFEAIKQTFLNPGPTEIFVLGRSRKGMGFGRRIGDLLGDDGAEYLSSPSGDAAMKDFLDRSIIGLDCDFTEERLGLSASAFDQLRAAPIDFFFHSAALTDFRNTPAVVDALKRVNVEGTRKVLNLVESLTVRQFSYVGSAYACGSKTGSIAPDYVNLDEGFRNPYERSKLQAEILVRSSTALRGVKRRIFRPSTICGRLIEGARGATNKFDVFYAWAAFFLKLKIQAVGHWDSRYSADHRMDIRACYNPQAGLNIVPADYAAKMLYAVCDQEDPGESYHLANPQETPHDFYLGELLRTVNITGLSQVDAIPADLNRLEQLYYRTVGAIYTPYLTQAPMLFDTDSLSGAASEAALKCPIIDQACFDVLMGYAKGRDFGIAGQT